MNRAAADGRRTVHIEQFIEVDASVHYVYSQWTKFDWSDQVVGRDVDWNAALLDARVEQRIEWRSGAGERLHGIAEFEALDPARTRIALRLDCEPPGLFARLSHSFGLTAAAVRRELRRFEEATSKLQHRLDCRELRRCEIERFRALTAAAMSSASATGTAAKNTAADHLATQIKGADRVEVIGRSD